MFNQVQKCILHDYDVAPEDQYSCQIYNHFYHKYQKQLVGLDKTQIMHTIQLNYFKGKYITRLEYWYHKYQYTDHDKKIGKYIIKELDNPNGLIHHHHKHQPVINHYPTKSITTLDDVIKAHTQSKFDNKVHILTNNGKEVNKY